MATLFPSKRFSRLALAAGLILVETFIVAARPSAVVQGGLGTIEGTVVQADSGLPISNAQVTLSGGGIKPQSLESLSQQLTESTFMPPEITINGVRGYYANTRGLPQPQVQEATIKVMTEGIGPSRENGVLEDGILQSIMRNANVNLGTSPYNSEFVSAIRNFRAANAQFKIVTDRSGRFTFRDVPEGQYTVRVERDGYYGQSGGAVPVCGTTTGCLWLMHRYRPLWLRIPMVCPRCEPPRRPGRMIAANTAFSGFPPVNTSSRRSVMLHRLSAAISFNR